MSNQGFSLVRKRANWNFSYNIQYTEKFLFYTVLFLRTLTSILYDINNKVFVPCNSRGPRTENQSKAARYRAEDQSEKITLKLGSNEDQSGSELLNGVSLLEY